MNIQRLLKFPFAPSNLAACKQSLLEHLPNITVNREELFCNIGRTLARPDVGRAIMGITAIGTQPFIDYYNPKVDRDTAKVSTFRTIGKIIAGTAVGCAVRSGCYYGVKGLTSLNPDAPSWRKALLPLKSIVQFLNERDTEWIKNYRSGLATLIGVGVMLATNVLFDVPLTNKITKYLLKKANVGDNTPKTNPTGEKVERTIPKQTPYDVKDRFKDVFIDKFDERNKWRANR